MDAAATKPIILYAEDDDDDFDSLKEVLEQLSDHQFLLHARNGQEAIAFIEIATTLPCLIVLDLNMPVMDGKEVLRWLKERDQYKHIPIMVFTTSSREEDKKLCQDYGCTFFIKPTLYSELLNVAQVILQLCEKNTANSSP